jgi:hypothetical protein
VRRGSTCAMPAEFQGGVANGNFMRCEERAIAPRACYLGTAINDVYKHQPNQLDVICRDRAPVPGQSVLYKPHGSLSHANQPVGKGVGLADSQTCCATSPSPKRGTAMTDREKILTALREKPMKVFDIMKRANITNQEACQSLLLKMRDDGVAKFDIHKGLWLVA